MTECRLNHVFVFNQGGHEKDETCNHFQDQGNQGKVEVNDDEEAMNNQKKKKKKKERRVLEIGSGPVPISMISASRWSEWIVCSDFLEQNRKNIKQWLTMTTITSTAAPGRRDDDETWLPFFRYVTQLERAE
jgi:nicotinamide N-methyltransferase/methyltransferase